MCLTLKQIVGIIKAQFLEAIAGKSYIKTLISQNIQGKKYYSEFNFLI